MYNVISSGLLSGIYFILLPDKDQKAILHWAVHGIGFPPQGDFSKRKVILKGLPTKVI